MSQSIQGHAARSRREMLLCHAALLGAILSACGESQDTSSTTTDTTTTASGGSTSTGGAGGTGGASSTSTGGTGGTGGDSTTSTGGAGGAGGSGGADPCSGSPVPGSLASGFRFSSSVNFDVGDTHVYVVNARKGDCPAEVVRFPKAGGAKEVIKTYSGAADAYEGAVGGDAFYWLASFRLWYAPLAGGGAAEKYFIQGTGSYQLALNATHAFAAQAASPFTVWRIPLAGGGADAIHSFSAVHPHFDLVADETALYVDSSGEIVRVPLDGGPSEVLVSGGIGTQIAMDATDIYFGQSGFLSRVPKGGGDITQVVAVSEGVRKMAVDATHVYWIDGSAVRRVAKAGGAEEILASEQENPSVIRVDDTSVYWATQGNGAIWKLPK